MADYRTRPESKTPLRNSIPKALWALGSLNAVAVVVANVWFCIRIGATGEVWVPVLAVTLVFLELHILVIGGLHWIVSTWSSSNRLSSAAVKFASVAGIAGICSQLYYFLSGQFDSGTILVAVITWPALGSAGFFLAYWFFRFAATLWRLFSKLRDRRFRNAVDPPSSESAIGLLAVGEDNASGVKILREVSLTSRGRVTQRRKKFLNLLSLACWILLVFALWPSATLELGLWLLIGSGMTLLCWVAALFVFPYLKGRKLVVLYLRRFGSDVANSVVSRALQNRLSENYRLVALDDFSFPALEFPVFQKWFSRIAPLLAVAACVALTANHFRSYVDLFSDPAAIIGGAVSVTLFEEIYFPMLFNNVWTVCLLLVFLLFHRFRIRRRARIGIQRAEELQSCLVDVRTLSGLPRASTLLAPQSTVVRVIDELWKPTVLSLSNPSAAIILDISEMTENIYWEMEQMLQAHRQKLILVADHRRLSQWLQDSSEDDVLVERARELLKDETVLIYESNRGYRDFANNLERLLANRARRSKAPAGALGGRRWLWKRRAQSLGWTLAGLFNAVLVSTVMSYALLQGAKSFSGASDLFSREGESYIFEN